MYGLSEQVVENLKNVFCRYDNLEKVVIFGSRAKGNYHDGSDIDLALCGDGITFRQLMQVSSDIDDLGLLYKVDLIDYNKKKSTPIGCHIDRVGQVFWSH